MSPTFAVLGVVAITLLSQVLKTYIYPKWGATGVQVLVAVLAVIVTGVYQLAQAVPSVLNFLLQAGGFLSSSIAAYELIFSKLPGFSGGSTLPLTTTNTNTL